MRRRVLTPILICALLALPGCGVVKSAAKRSVVRFLSGAVAGMLFGKDDADADDGAVAPYGDTGDADDESAAVAEEDEEVEAGDAQPSSSGFYKVIEPNGTIRFVSRIEDVPTSQRSKAERLAMERSSDPVRPKRRVAPRRTVQQLAAADRSEPAAVAPSGHSGNHEVVVYTTSWCGWCKKTRAWLDQEGIDYENRDIESNASWAEEMHDLTGSGGVPVIVIDGEVIKGFDQARMEKLLRG